MTSLPESAAPPPASGVDDAPRPDRGIVTNALFGLLSQVITASFTLILTLYLVRALGPAGYGLFTLALSIGAIALWISDFGLASSAARFIAERVDDRTHVRRLLGVALRLKLIGSLGMALLLVVLAPVLSDLFGGGLTWPVRAMALSLFFESMVMLCVSGFGALRRVDLGARMQLFESFTETTASIGLVLVGTGVGGAILGRAAGYGIGLLVGVYLLLSASGRPRLRYDVPARAASRAILRYSIPLIVVNGAYNLYVYIDALLIGALLSETEVAQFNAPLRLITVIGYIGTSIATAVAPRLAGDEPDVQAFERWLRITTLVQALLIVPLVVWAGPIVQLTLGDEYEEAGEVLRALAPYAFLFGVGPLVTASVVFFGSAGRRVPIVIGALLVNAAIDVVLLPRIGVLGATIGTGVAMAIYIPAHLRICVQRLGLRWTPMLLTAARALVAGAASAGALWLIGTSDLAVWQWALGAVACPAVFLLALVVMREVSVDDVRGAVAGIRRRVRPS